MEYHIRYDGKLIATFAFLTHAKEYLALLQSRALYPFMYTLRDKKGNTYS